jgi:hypothetical protein
MDPHATATHEHAHPTPGVYAKVGFILFVLTALEVALYEITYGTNAVRWATSPASSCRCSCSSRPRSSRSWRGSTCT